MNRWFAMILTYMPDTPIIHGYMQGEAPLSGMKYRERCHVLMVEIERRQPNVHTLMRRNTTFTIAIFVDDNLLEPDALQNLKNLCDTNHDEWMDYVYQLQVEYGNIRKYTKKTFRKLFDFGTDIIVKKKTCL